MIKLLGMIILGILGAILSRKNKNLYLGVFDDILGRAQDDPLAIRVSRGFVYGFFLPIYLVLLVAGVAALIFFLVVAGIAAAIAFLIVWASEKIIPHQLFGDLLEKGFGKLGWKAPEEPVAEAATPADPSPSGPLPPAAEFSESPESPPTEAPAEKAPDSADSEPAASEGPGQEAEKPATETDESIPPYEPEPTEVPTEPEEKKDTPQGGN